MLLRTLLFPGQSSHYVGMAKNVSSKSKYLFEIASNIIGYDILSLCNDGPIEQLHRTDHQQMAIWLSSVASFYEYSDQLDLNSIDYCLGFSLGEISALTIAECFSFEDGVRLVDIRGKAMYEASLENESGMIHIMGRDLNINNYTNEVNKLKEKYSNFELFIGNYISSNNFTIGGDQLSLNIFKEYMNSDECKIIDQYSELDVSGAFHTPFMKSAQVSFNNCLDTIKFSPPKYNVLSNITGEAYTDDIVTTKKNLLDQIISPVRWDLIMESIVNKKNKTNKTIQSFEFGPKKSLSTILKRRDRRSNVNTFDLGHEIVK